MPEEFIEIAGTETRPIMSVFEDQSVCLRFNDCEIVRQYGLQRSCDDMGYCCPGNKETNQ